VAYRNPKLLARLPATLLLLASHPLAIRGRDLNVWLSPVHGSSLLFSLALRAQLPVNSLIFTQYLATLAVIEACRDKSVLGPEAGAYVKIKWPTNVYIIDKNGNGKKVGGVLVTKVDRAGGADLIIGEQTIMPLLIISFALCTQGAV
jgi:biotin---protein ligase